jgi:hypothetical protein
MVKHHIVLEKVARRVDDDALSFFLAERPVHEETGNEYIKDTEARRNRNKEVAGLSVAGSPSTWGPGQVGRDSGTGLLARRHNRGD